MEKNKLSAFDLALQLSSTVMNMLETTVEMRWLKSLLCDVAGVASRIYTGDLTASDRDRIATFKKAEIARSGADAGGGP